jgi:hypothetical protein
MWTGCHLLLTPSYVDGTGGASRHELLLMLWAALLTGAIFGELIGREVCNRHHALPSSPSRDATSQQNRPRSMHSRTEAHTS